MPIVRRQDRPVLVRGARLPTLQRLVDRASGSAAVTVLINVFAGDEAVPNTPTRSKRSCWSRPANASSPSMAGRKPPGPVTR